MDDDTFFFFPGATDVQAEVSGQQVWQSRPGGLVSEASLPLLLSGYIHVR